MPMTWSNITNMLLSRRLLDWRSIVCYVLVFGTYQSEAFATSFRPSSTGRGGSSTVQQVLANPNKKYEEANGVMKEKFFVNGKISVKASIKTAATAATPASAVDVLMDASYVAETNLPNDIGDFRLRAYRTAPSNNPFTGNEPCVIYATDKPPFGTNGNLKEGVPVRVHDQCLTSEVFGSHRCDCKEQLNLAMKYVKKNGGAIIYLQQEGRGIGLANKVAAYSLQDNGMDTVDANLHLGFPEDMRQYGVIPSILSDMRIKSIQLMTNNPRKLDRLTALGVSVDNTVPMVVHNANAHNRRYLETKQNRMNHVNFGEMLSRDLRPLRTNGSMTPMKAAASVAAASNFIVEEEDAVVVNGGSSALSGVTARDDGYCFGRTSVEEAIAAIARGEMVCVVDDMDRENEGDLIMAADLCTPELMAKIIRYSSGVVCVAMEGDRMDELKLPAMVTNNEDPKETAFSVTVDASKDHGITTGISARDRSLTVQLLANGKMGPNDFSRPGHIFPLRAKAGGVLERDGHTEATVDLSRLAGRGPCGVLCEIVSEENPTEMARLPELIRFCQTHNMVLTSIVDLQQYRRDTEQ